MAPPYVRLTRPACSSWAKSLRTVASDTQPAAQVGHAHRAFFLDGVPDELQPFHRQKIVSPVARHATAPVAACVVPAPFVLRFVISLRSCDFLLSHFCLFTI